MHETLRHETTPKYKNSTPFKIFLSLLKLTKMMKRGNSMNKFDSLVVVSRLRSLQLLTCLVFVYFCLMTSQFPVLFRFFEKSEFHESHGRFVNETRRKTPEKMVSELVFRARGGDNGTIYKTAMHAWKVGSELWAHLKDRPRVRARARVVAERCPEKVAVGGSGFKGVVRMPCGLTLGSHVTVVGRPRRAHREREPSISLGQDVMVAQFMVELRGEREVRWEEAARLLHFNPRIKGDWSEKPVIEMNNCYRGQWGQALRCEGWPSSPNEETVDRQVKCEKWIRDDPNRFEESKSKLWLENLMGRRKKDELDWPYPFLEDKFFVLTITTGLEGYHITVNGRHITSFAYRNGFDLEDAIVLHVYGDVDVHSVFAASLPTSHPSVAPERHLEMSSEWKAQPLPHDPVDLFIGVISAGDHFVERMAVRKSWMQHHLIKSSIVVARFFVALHEKETINVELRKEAEYFGDIIIVPYLDNYDLVVLKTLAICEYGVKMVSTKYIMKCDDDTFVRVDAVIEQAHRVNSQMSLYAGKMNYFHMPLRSGKWAVTHEEWPGEIYPPYADGPGYIVSSDIARFIVTEFHQNRLRLFKMEDVSMGMWVEQFNSSKPVVYLHNSHFHQSGCIDGYYTAHYQSPRQLICLWERLQTEGKAICCNL